MAAKKAKAAEAPVHEFEPVVPEAIEANEHTQGGESGIFDDLDDEPEPTLAAFTRPDDGIVLDAGLTVAEKAEFVRLLNQFLPIKDRAIQLAKLAMYTDTKRAAVGLRAIQEVNAITNMGSSAPMESTPMFALPSDTKVSVTITKVVK